MDKVLFMLMSDYARKFQGSEGDRKRFKPLINKGNRRFGLFLCVFLVLWCFFLAVPLGAQQKNGPNPEDLLKVLREGAVSLEKDIASEKAEANEVKEQVEQAEESLQNLRSQIAALRAAQAAGELQSEKAREALDSFSEREEQVASHLSQVRQQREKLAQHLAARIDAFNGLKKEVERLKATKHPILNSPQVRQAYERYQQLAPKYQTGATQILKLRDEVILTLEQEQQVLKETIKELKNFVELTQKEVLLKRQDLVSLMKTIKQIFLDLIQLPGRLINYLTDPELPQNITVTLRAYWAQLLSLLTTFLILAWIAHRLRQLLLPHLRQWQSDTEELDVKVILKAGEIISTHLIGLSFVTWLALSLGILGWWQKEAAKVLLIGVFVWVGLRIGLELIQAVFAGKEQGGILSLEETTARFYRRHLKLMLVYALVIGLFGLNLFLHLGTDLEGYDFLELIIQVGFLVWMLWLLRKRYLAKLLDVVPGLVRTRVRVFFFLVRAFLWLVLGATLLTGLLGFQKIAANLARGASLIVIIVFLFWLIELSARGVFDHVFFPKKGQVPKKIQRQEELLRSYYLAVLKVVVSILVGGVFLLVLNLLNLWGIDLGFLKWVYKGLAWGPKLGPVSLSLLNLGLAALTLYLGRWFSRFLQTLLEVRYYPRTDWDESLRYTISNSCHYAIQTFAILIALGFLGVSFGDLAIVAGGLGVGIGFGLQNIVNNFISGLILLFERPIKVGDMLVIDGQWGTVKEIRVRSTIFQTFDRYALIIPNSDLISNKITNWTHYGPGINRLTLKIGVSYDSDVRQVTKLLDEVCRANPRVVPDPPPMIYFEAYGDSSLNFNIWVHVRSVSDRIPATHELNSAIFEAFQKHGIEIPFPQRDLYVKSWPETPSHPALPPEGEA